MTEIFYMWLSFIESITVSLLVDTVLGYILVLAIVFMVIVGIFSILRRLKL